MQRQRNSLAPCLLILTLSSSTLKKSCIKMTIKTNFKRFALSLAASLLIAGAAHADAAKAPIRLATTTSTEQSGLLGWLLPQFTKETGYPVQVMAAGTGQSLKMGENGDADLVMTHAPSAEKKFVDAGFGIEPGHLMYNDFVIVGPAKDPAGLAKLHDEIGRAHV